MSRSTWSQETKGLCLLADPQAERLQLGLPSDPGHCRFMWSPDLLDLVSYFTSFSFKWPQTQNSPVP